MRRPRVEILYFEGCPNHEAARELVERVAAELRIEPDLDLVEVPHSADRGCGMSARRRPARIRS